MNTKYKLISQITLAVLMVIGLVATVMFFAGPETTVQLASGEFTSRQYDSLFLFAVYFFLCLATLGTLGFLCKRFVDLCGVSPKKAITVIGVLIAVCAVAAACWFAGSPAEVEIPGYDGTDNVGNWARLSDAVIYMCYIMLGGTLCAMLGGFIYTKTLK